MVKQDVKINILHIYANVLAVAAQTTVAKHNIL